jgi:hypothetical protein
MAGLWQSLGQSHKGAHMDRQQPSKKQVMLFLAVPLVAYGGIFLFAERREVITCEASERTLLSYSSGGAPINSVRELSHCSSLTDNPIIKISDGTGNALEVSFKDGRAEKVTKITKTFSGYQFEIVHAPKD